MIEMGEREAGEAVAEKEAAETAAHAALMKGANLEVASCFKCTSCRLVSYTLAARNCRYSILHT